MGGAALRLNLNPFEAFVSNRYGKFGRLRDDTTVCTPFGDKRLSADAGVLFVHHARDHQAPSRQAT
jgi:hypothetical protein